MVAAPRRVCKALADQIRWRRQRWTELPKDWWQAFEMDFREYTSGDWTQAREAERHR